MAGAAGQSRLPGKTRDGQGWGIYNQSQSQNRRTHPRNTLNTLDEIHLEHLRQVHRSFAALSATLAQACTGASVDPAKSRNLASDSGPPTADLNFFPASFRIYAVDS